MEKAYKTSFDDTVNTAVVRGPFVASVCGAGDVVETYWFTDHQKYRSSA